MNKLKKQVYAKVFDTINNVEILAEILDYQCSDILEETEFIFDWHRIIRRSTFVSILKLPNNKQIEGIISYEIDKKNQAMYVSLIVVANRNKTRHGIIKGIMEALFAYVAMLGIDSGNDALFFKAKFQLMHHYETTLHAKRYVIPNRMIIKNVDMLFLIRTWLIWKEE